MKNAEIKKIAEERLTKCKGAQYKYCNTCMRYRKDETYNAAEGTACINYIYELNYKAMKKALRLK